MKFNLHYRGPLKSNGRPQEKHLLRKYFHAQLEDLWKRSPLVHQAQNFLNPQYELTAVTTVKGLHFASVVNATNHLVAEIDILMLRPEEPGALVTQGGDIDNRLKTLLDALSIPKPDQVVTDEPSSNGITHCLLADDNLVTGLGVRVDRLLGSEDPSEVLLIIGVVISATRGTLKNLELSI